MASLDTTALMTSITDAASGIVRRDVTTVRGFAREQLAALARQAETIAAMQAAGAFDDNDDLREHFTRQLQEMTRNFARTLQGLAAVTAEKLANAVLDVVRNAITTATGVALPRPGKG
jgi:hypothetical protein